MSYQVGVDLGTTWTAAAVCREDGGTELVPLGERSPAVPSAVFVGEDGVFMIGEAAERRALSDPGRVVREFKRRIGDRTPLVVGGTPMAPEVLAARFVARILQHVADREGGPATRVMLTHPAGWGPHKLESLRAALAAEGLGAAELLPEPQAAAIGYANAARVEAGAVIAVYDLGGGTFDTAVVRKPDTGGFELLGHPEGLERLGGIDFDEVVFEHVRAELGTAWDGLGPSDPDVLAAVATLRQECTAAKEALSHDTEATIPVVLPGVHSRVRLERAAFEEMIRPAVAETATLLRRAIDSARLGPGIRPIVLLVGGSSRIPLVGRMIGEATGAPVAVDVDPKGVIATGAALAAHRADGGPARAGGLPAVAATAVEPEPPDDGAATAAAGPPPPQSVPFGGVRPFRAPRTAPRRRPVVVITVAAAIVAALAVGGGILSGVYRTGTVTPTGPSAEASTPAAGTPQPGSGAGTKPPERGPVRQRPSGAPAASVPAPPAPPPAPDRAEIVPTTPPSAPTSSSAPAPAPAVPPADESAGSGDPGSGGDTGGDTPPDPGAGGAPAQEQAPAGSGAGDNAGSDAGSATGGPGGGAGDSSGAGTDPAGSGPAESTPGASSPGGGGPGGGGPGAEAFTAPEPAPAAGPEQPGGRQPDAAASADGAGPQGAGPPGAGPPGAAEPGAPDGAAAGPSGTGPG